MTDEKNLTLNANQGLEEIAIAPEVIEVIIGIAASKVEGVYEMRGTFVNSVTGSLGRAAHGKGVYLANEEDGLRVDLYCYLEYGVSVSKVAMEMQEWVSQQVLSMADINLSEVNIHVVAVVLEKLEQPTTEEFFEDEEEESEQRITKT